MPSRYYLDYNATSPLVSPVKEYLTKGDLPFANPASSHSLGRESKKMINEAKSFILETFNLSHYEVLFHSGASEWMSTVFNLNAEDVLFYFESDHSAVTENAYYLQKKGVKVISLPLNNHGTFDIEEIIDLINKHKGKEKNWLNFTYVHNETGVIWNLKDAESIKERTGVSINVDSVQLVSKKENWENLNNTIDTYVFSAHKFGAIKSLGFTLIKKGVELNSLIRGGSQQSLRSGTENTLACHLTKLALDFHKKSNKTRQALSFRERLEKEIDKNPCLEVLSKNINKSVNTIGFIHLKETSDLLLAKFDLAGLLVSRGSACSSGSTESLKTLIAMGKESFAKNFIRISFSPLMDFNEDELFESLSKTIARL